MLTKILGTGVARRLGSRALRLRQSLEQITYGGAPPYVGTPFIGTRRSVLLDRQRPALLTNRDIARIASTDPIINAIRRTLRLMVVQQPWEVVVDIDIVKDELQRWRAHEIQNLNNGIFGVAIRFESDILPPKYRALGEQMLYRKRIIGLSRFGKIQRINAVFDALEQIAEQDQAPHVTAVRRLLEKPNRDSETSLRALLDRVVDDICVFDAGCIVKNPPRYGKGIAELYEVPGDEIWRYRNPDRSVPQPPDPAYLWKSDEQPIAQFTNDELVYMMMNPQKDGYGMSPIEMAVYIILGSLSADKSNLDLVHHTVIPPVIFDLGPTVTPEQRAQWQDVFLSELFGPQSYRFGTVAGLQGFQVHTLWQRGQSFDMGLQRFLQYCIGIKCMVYGLSPQDVGVVLDFHRTTAEVQERLTRIRGVRALFSLLEAYINAEIVKPFVPQGMVKFRFAGLSGEEAQIQQQIDLADLRAGIITRNDRRRARGLPPTSWGNIPTIETGMGLIPAEKLEEYIDELRAGLIEQSRKQESKEAVAGGGILPNSGLIPGASAQELGAEAPELGNIYAEMGKSRADRQEVDKRVWPQQQRWVSQAIEEGDLVGAFRKTDAVSRWWEDEAWAYGIDQATRESALAWLADTKAQIVSLLREQRGEGGQ